MDSLINSFNQTAEAEATRSFFHAAADGRLEFVGVFLENYPQDVDITDDKGMTALMWAAASGEEAIVLLLFEKNAGLDRQDNSGWRALAYAAFYGHDNIVKIFLERGADAEALDDTNITAEGRAMQQGHAEAASILRRWPAEQKRRAEEEKQRELDEEIKTFRTTLTRSVAYQGPLRNPRK